MNPDDTTNNKDFDAEFTLPGQVSSAHSDNSSARKSEDNSNAAAELIRKKVHEAYASEPDAATEALDLAEIGKTPQTSKHQEYMYELTNSGKSLAEINQAWHEYYGGLSDAEKHEVWQEFYSSHAQASQYANAAQAMAPKAAQVSDLSAAEPDFPATKHSTKNSSSIKRTMADLREYTLSNVSSPKKLKPMQHFQSLLFGLGVGSVVVLIFLFSFFNERFIAPFIQPSRNVSNLPIITSDAASGANPEIIIPKINVEIPVVYDEPTIDEHAVQTALEKGVVHYADTASPGQNGNTVIVGHSSNNIFNKGKYKFAFVLLSRMEKGDTFYLQKDGKKYTYQVFEKKIVKPNEVDVLAPGNKAAVATLITCDPPGTTISRLVVVGEQISPDPSTNSSQVAQNALATKTRVVPGNSPSLWSRLWNWL